MPRPQRKLGAETGRLMTRDNLIIGGGSRDRKLLVPPATLAAHPHAEVIEGLAKVIES